ncbi:Zinc finger protein rsv2 [Sphaceloma murrayae]|uniref:Zinc finger protein rsv2 n=1 Tax=Sphaceloma murrayae TaxID=2082308 RepID=A0A2K1QJI1_9PEZI|nr:Zinc finger protein rsv2 [Sphaceloma murrayae]
MSMTSSHNDARGLPSHFHVRPSGSVLDLSELDPTADLYSSFLSTSGINHKPHALMNGHHQHDQYPSIRIQKPNNPFSQPLYQDLSQYQQSPAQHAAYDWQTHQNPHYQTGNQAYQFQSPISSASRHTRQYSDSSIASTSPGTPYNHNIPFTFVANPDRSPSTTNQYADNSFDWAKGKAAAYQAHTYLPSQPPHSSVAHLALRDMTMDQHNSGVGIDEVPELFSSRHSNSSHGRNTPNTPRTSDESSADDRTGKMPANGNKQPLPFVSNGYSRIANAEHQRGHIELYRTESAACQDALFDASTFNDAPPSSQAAAPSSTTTQKNLLAPHGNLVNEIVGKANQNRSSSPNVTREKSPFRQGSELYPRSPATVMPSAASIRQKQKEEADQKEYAAHQPKLRREATQTMSPKDALKDGVDYDDTNSMALFNDILPEGYERNLGGTESYPNNFISGTNQAFGQYVNMNSNVGGFRGVDLNNFLHSPMEPATESTSYLNQPFASSQRSDKTPEFPAQLTSMESSASEQPTASQESNAAPLQRPASTAADTGTYTCTYHGCTQRFESPAKLQKHKREAHQSVSNHASVSPASPSSTSPEPTGMTSSAALARNSQAGPHKCSRINPTTGKPCNTIFSRPYDLTRHEDTIHNKGKQKVQCQYCREEKSFSRNDALTRHMRVVHPDIDFQGKRGRRDY